MNKLKIRTLSQTSIICLIRHASFYLIVGLHLQRRMPTSEHCWKKNICAQWARTSNIWITVQTRSLLSYVGRYVEWDLNFYCTMQYVHVVTNLHVTASCEHNNFISKSRHCALNN